MNEDDRLLSDHWLHKQAGKMIYGKPADDGRRTMPERTMPELFGPGCGDRTTDRFFDWVIIGIIAGISLLMVGLLFEDPRPPLPTTPPAVEQVQPTLP